MVITFNGIKTIKEKVETGNYSLEVKEAELFLTIYDSNSNIVFRDAFIVREKKPKSIPETNHIIEAQFIYIPPNPMMVYRIPDFIILAVSLKH